MSSRVPGLVGLDFDLSALSSGIYGFLLVIFMLLRPEGLLPEPRSRVRFVVPAEIEARRVDIEVARGAG